MKRHNIEVLLAWLDALRRGDQQALIAALDPAITWRGIRRDLVCHGREEVIEVFLSQRDQGYDIDAMELIGASQHAILHARPTEPRAVGDETLDDGVYNLFRIEGGKITHLADYRARRDAFRAAGLEDPAPDGD